MLNWRFVMDAISPQLSIIVPCYNYGHYLEGAIQSVLDQNYQDFEIILIDDGSTDQTWEILQKQAAHNSCIRIFKNEKNIGLFKSAQKGILEAKGGYFHFFSSDDFYQPEALSNLMALLLQNPELGVACADIAYLEEETVTTHRLLPASTTPLIIQPNEVMALFQQTDFWIPGTTCIIKADRLEKYGFFDQKLENISDWYFFHKLALLEGIGYLPRTFVTMRKHAATYSVQVKKDKKRRRATYKHLLKILSMEPQIDELFKNSGLLSFIFRDFGWKARLNPYYFKYFPHLKK